MSTTFPYYCVNSYISSKCSSHYYGLVRKYMKHWNDTECMYTIFHLCLIEGTNKMSGDRKMFAWLNVHWLSFGLLLIIIKS